MSDESSVRRDLRLALDDPELRVAAEALDETIERAASGRSLSALLEIRDSLGTAVYRPAIAVAANEGSDFLLDECAAALETKYLHGHIEILEVVGLLGGAVIVEEDAATAAVRRARCHALAAPWLSKSGRRLRGAAAMAVTRCGDPGILAGIKSGHLDIPANDAIEVIGLAGDVSCWTVLVTLIDGGNVYSLRLASAVAALGDRVGMTEAVAKEVVSGLLDSAECLQDEEIMETMLGAVARLCPSLYRRLARRWLAERDEALCQMLAASLKHARDFDPVPLLLLLVRPDQDPGTIRSALWSLHQVAPAVARRAALGLLQHEDRRVRLRAVSLLRQHPDRTHLDALLPCTADVDGDVRAAALLAVYQHDDLRVLTAALAALNDPHEHPREAAMSLLRDGADRWRRHPWYREDSDGEPWWEPLMAELAGILARGRKVGHELLGRNVRIIQYRQGLGRTPVEVRHGVVDLEISDVPLLSGHPNGADIVRALILHEIGHHLYDIGQPGQRTMEERAASEGLHSIFCILMDERLERKLRSRRPAWGVYFDRLASYAFAQDEHLVPLAALAELVQLPEEAVLAAVQSGRLPGRPRAAITESGERMVAMSGPEMLALPKLRSPLMLFLGLLRCRSDMARCPDARVTEAVEAVPRHLKDLDHAGVLNVARRVGALIGRDDRHRRDLRRLRRHLDRHQQPFGALRGLLDRLAEAGQRPEDLLDGSATVTTARDSPGVPAAIPGFARSGRREGTATRLPRARSRWTYEPQPGAEFEDLVAEAVLTREPVAHAELVRAVARHVRVLRPFLGRLGVGEETESGQRRGRRLDRAALAGAVLRGSPEMFLHHRRVVRADCYIGILIDSSGSMSTNGKIERARAFGALVAESAARAPGVTGHVNAFGSETFIRLGTFENHAIASLETGGGNNDSGGLKRAAMLARASGRAHRLLIMISDGMPSECSQASLQALVEHLTRREGIVCAQVAVDTVPEVAFPNFVDLSAMEFDEAVARFGRLLVKLTADWR